MRVEVAPPNLGMNDFESLFRAQYGRINRLIRRITGEPGAAEELAADIFLKLLRKPPAEEIAVEKWLSQLAVWAAIDHLRSSARRIRQSTASAADDEHSGSHRQWELREEQWRVRSVLQRLKREQASLLLLREEGYTYAEMAEALGRNPASIGTLMTRAEAAFRKEWMKAYGKHR